MVNEDEEDNLANQFTNNKYAKGDKSVYLNKHKGKPTKIEQKERQLFRKTQSRKKSSLDEQDEQF
jgi:hypothetical protein